MAYGVVHQFAGGTKEQYEASIAAVHPSDGSLPEGQLFHAAGRSADGWTIVAIHDSQESWERFRDGVLMPRMAEGSTGASPLRRRRRHLRFTTRWRPDSIATAGAVAKAVAPANTVRPGSGQARSHQACRVTVSVGVGVRARGSGQAAARRSTARTVDGHHCAPPCAVGTCSALSSRAISPRLLPPACSAWIRPTMLGATLARRPGRAPGFACARAGRRRSATKRCSSSTGISRAPHGISTVSTRGRMRRLKVERLTPSASAACVRV